MKDHCFLSQYLSAVDSYERDAQCGGILDGTHGILGSIYSALTLDISE